MRVFALAFAIACLTVVGAGGCIQTTVRDGTLQCSGVPGRDCPRGYHCAVNNYCYQDGHDPESGPDLRRPADLAPPPDLLHAFD